MTADEVVAAFAARFGDEAAGAVAYGQPTVDVPVARWLDALAFARDELGASFFDWLSAVDELDDGFSVVIHLWSVRDHVHVLVRTRVPREDPSLPSATGLFAGAAWHERETHEMFGVAFTGFDDGTGLGLRPLLLPDGFEGRPLRKEFVLAARAAKPWPGAKEPGESDADAGSPSRRKTLPPGVPDPAAWGPRPPGRPALDADAQQADETGARARRGGAAVGQRPPRRRGGAPRRTRTQAEATPAPRAERPVDESGPPAERPAERSAPPADPQR